MSDGTTATQVSPIPTESEMAGIKTIFERAANAIVQASELSIKVTELTKQFDELKANLDHAMARNRELDQMLYDVREQRDAAKTELEKTKADLFVANNELSKDGETIKNQDAMIHALQDQLTAARTDRDNALMKGMEMEEALASCKAKLAKVQALFSPEPEPTKPIEPTTPEPSPPEPMPSSPNYSF